MLTLLVYYDMGVHLQETPLNQLVSILLLLEETFHIYHRNFLDLSKTDQYILIFHLRISR